MIITNLTGTQTTKVTYKVRDAANLEAARKAAIARGKDKYGGAVVVESAERSTFDDSAYVIRLVITTTVYE